MKTAQGISVLSCDFVFLKQVEGRLVGEGNGQMLSLLYQQRLAYYCFLTVRVTGQCHPLMIISLYGKSSPFQKYVVSGQERYTCGPQVLLSVYLNYLYLI